MAVGPKDYWGDLSPETDEVEWPVELPAHIQDWLNWWFDITLPVQTYRHETRYWDDNRFAVAA